MADHITVVVSGGATKILQTTDNTTYHTPAHQIVRSDGTVPLKPVAEDAAHSSGDSGIIAMGVRSDTAAALGGTDGDYMPMIFDSAGKLHVNVGAFTPGTAAGSLGKAEDAAHTTGDTGVMLLAVRNDTHSTALAGTDGDYTPLGVDSSGKIGIRGTFAEDAAHTTADLGVFVLAVRSDTAAATGGTDGDYCGLIVDSTGKLHVNVGAFTPGTAAGSLGKAEDAAHTTGDTGVFVLAVANSTHTTALVGTDGDYSPIAVDTTGKVGIRGTFAEDAGHSSGDLGIHVLTVRQDTAAALAGTDADYQPFITDASGRLHVNVGAITAGTTATALGKAEDAAHTTGDTGVFVLAVRSDTAASTGGTDGDYVALITDSAGKLHTNVGAVTPGTAASSLGKAEDAAHTTGDVGVMALGVRNDADAAISGTDLDYTPFATDSAGRQKVNVIEERVVVDVTPVCDTSAYTANDVLFDRITTGTIARANGGTVVLESVVVLDEDDQTAAEMDLYFLDSDVTLGTINNAISITDANARTIVGHVNIPAANFKDTINSKIAFVKNVGMTMKCAAGSAVLYVAGVTAGTPTQTASGIKLKLAFRQGE